MTSANTYQNKSQIPLLRVLMDNRRISVYKTIIYLYILLVQNILENVSSDIYRAYCALHVTYILLVFNVSVIFEVRFALVI
jgi:hypothetical protein